MWTIEEAFKHCLENKIKKECSKGNWASFKHRFNKGKLSEAKVKTLLEKYGYFCYQHEQWTESLMMFTIAKFDKLELKASINQIEAKSAIEAITINGGGVDVTNDIEAFNKYINRSLDEIKGY